MSTVDLFIKNHKNILSVGPCLLTKTHGAPSPDQAYHLLKNHEYGRFDPIMTAHHYGLSISPVCDKSAYSIRAHGVAGGCEGINITRAGADLGVRYLDYFSDGVTSMCLDDAARVVFTGPLEGCYVAVGRSYNSTMLFHANDNKTGGGSPENRRNKINFIRTSATGFWACKLESLLVDTDYKDPELPYRAFVYGVKNSEGDWDFFYHSIVLEGRWRVLAASAELPAC